jgi:hypothetical protein
VEPAPLAPEASAHVPAAATETKTEYQSQPAPVHAEPRPVEPAPDPADLERALTESGLELIQTRSGTVTEPAPEPQFVPAKRSRRTPPPEFGEPMVQVETTQKHDPST